MGTWRRSTSALARGTRRAHARGRSALCAALAACALLAPGTAPAWSGHALCTWQALAPLTELSPKRVRTETLEQFLAAQAPQLERVLAAHEAWARATLEYYAPRPDGLAFKAPPPGVNADLRNDFLKALRLNVASRLPLFRQLRPGEDAGAAAALPWAEVTPLRSGRGASANRYVRLAAGDEVAVADVVATASAEPDYGLDLGLFEDNGTAQGKLYGFGTQPFGNAALDFSSQAPFHMGFHHEARLVFAAAGFLRRTQPDARIALFSALARHALATGHDYWGWRFTGWALHYVQDLTQPYHARVLPGVGAARMIGVNTLAIVGVDTPKLQAITRVSNRHTALENYQFRRMVLAYEQGRSDDALLAALRDTRQDREHWVYAPADTRSQVSREAAEAADALDAQLERSLPARYVVDTDVNLGTEASDALDFHAIARAHSEAEHGRLEQQVAARLVRMGLHSRALVRAMVAAPPK